MFHIPFTCWLRKWCFPDDKSPSSSYGGKGSVAVCHWSSPKTLEKKLSYKLSADWKLFRNCSVPLLVRSLLRIIMISRLSTTQWRCESHKAAPLQRMDLATYSEPGIVYSFFSSEQTTASHIKVDHWSWDSCIKEDKGSERLSFQIPLSIQSY